MPTKKTDLAYALAAQGGHPVKRLCETLGVARSNIVERGKKPRKPRGHYAMPNELRQWLADLPGPWMGAMEATLFTGWIYDFLKPHAVELTERNISVGCWGG